jgi:diguanylate cyclase (GGDEF)-like protein
MTFGPDGALWTGAAQGLSHIDPQTSRIMSFRHDPRDPSTLSGSAVEAVAFGVDGTLWVGTVNGLNAFDPVRGKAVRIPDRPGAPDGLPAKWVPDLMRARDGRLWVATSGGAAILTSWDGKTARFDSVSAHLGRKPAQVDSLIEDDEGQVWLGPRLRVDPKTWRWRELGPADGCELHDFFIASRARTASGTLLFGSPGGLLIVYPERLAPWTYSPPLVATTLRVDGVERPGAARLRHLTLRPGERGFRLDFAALDFTAPARLAYRYELEGYDEAWTRTAGAQPTLAYNGLGPGDYRLRIQGTNRTGQWSAHEILLPITVLPAFYQTWWFRTLAGLALLALVYLGVRLRLRRLEARSRELEEMVRERTQSLEERGRELAEAYDRIEEASLTDPLTGLRNRRYQEQSIGADLEITTRRHLDGPSAGGEADLVFLLLDLDHFKRVNDSYGHAAGDLLLRQTADLLRATFRTSDTLVRWGGEEFLVVARFVDRRQAAELAEKVCRALAAHDFVVADGLHLQRTVSAGWAVYPFDPARPQAVGWQEVVALADAALYEAKRTGRNRWVGIELAEGADPEEALRAFKADPGGVEGQQGLRLRRQTVNTNPGE